jgi:hypothetical protein
MLKEWRESHFCAAPSGTHAPCVPFICHVDDQTMTIASKTKPDARASARWDAGALPAASIAGSTIALAVPAGPAGIFSTSEPTVAAGILEPALAQRPNYSLPRKPGNFYAQNLFLGEFRPQLRLNAAAE